MIARFVESLKRLLGASPPTAPAASDGRPLPRPADPLEHAAAAPIAEDARPAAVAVAEPEAPTLGEEPLPAEEPDVIEEPSPVAATEIADEVAEAADAATEEETSAEAAIADAPTEDGTSLAVEPAKEPAVVAAGLVLRLESARDQGVEFAVTRTGATVGRAPENAIRLDDLSVSRRHARIAYRQGAYWLSDVGSMGGTWVDGVKLNAPRRLAPGQVIDIGVCRLTVLTAAVPAAASAARSRASSR